MKTSIKMWVLSLLLVVFVAGHAHGGICPDTTAPTVKSTIPASAATSVAVNRKIAVAFSEPMDPATITTATFTIEQGTTPVSGTVTYAGATAIFTPEITLEPNTEYTATIDALAKDRAGNNLAGMFAWNFTTGAAADTTTPTVKAANPASGATDVPINRKIAVTFSEPMDPATLTTATFILKRGTTLVSGKVTTYAYAKTAIFTPEITLVANTKYTAVIRTGPKDLAGNDLARFVWSFTTGAAADITVPTVKTTIPASDATSVPINRKITATFNEPMDPSTLTAETFTLEQGTAPVAGTVTYVGRTAIFTPEITLEPYTEYTSTINALAKDRAGNNLAGMFAWNFTTRGVTEDTTAPTVESTNPASDATDVPNRKIAVTFSELMDPSTITTGTFTLKQGTMPVAGKVTYVGATAIFTPTAFTLLANTQYTAAIGTGAKDLAGNNLAGMFVWSFTTGEPTGELTVDLGLAGAYAILAESGITTTGSTLITGDIGVSPIAAGAMTGFELTLDASTQFATSPLVVGKVYAADYSPPTPVNLTTAVGNMETAYTDAAGRTLPDATELGAGEIGGMTIAPGLYKWSADVLITTDVTLKGCPEDVWIFQIEGNLTVASGKSVILSGGAQAKNIFWQVAGGVGVAIGTTAHMEGIILAKNAITVQTGASWNGRALAQKAVTLDANAITEPN
ncbi:MAG: Ig-like domain-containing protein [Syntrophobacteraceae bacterium]